MFNSFLLIMIFLVMGEVGSSALDLPVPGAVIGMFLMFLYLCAKGTISDDMQKTSDFFIKYIALFFIPAGAGVSLYFSLIAQEWLVIIVASMVSTIFTLLSVALVFNLLRDKKDG